jgi:hypothetical protein
VKTPFDPPAGWDGACTANKTIPAGVMCSGKLCVQSISISAPVVQEQPCQAHPHDPAPLPPGAQKSPRAEKPGKLPEPPPDTTIASACAPPSPWPVCKGDEPKLCVPEPGEGFATCVRQAGDVACPSGWPVRRLFFDEMADGRSCSGCACSAPTGSVCLVSISLASDATCSGFPLQGAVVTSEKPTSCHDLPPGVALTSKAAAFIAYEPGACEPTGGETVGEVFPSDPVTFCCLDD